MCPDFDMSNRSKKHPSCMTRILGFVAMETVEEAETAITALNSTDIMGQIITVEKVKPLQCGEFVTCLTLGLR